MAIPLQSVSVTAEAPRGGMLFLTLITLSLLYVAWRLRNRRRFWLMYACCVSANLLGLFLAPEHNVIGSVLDVLYWPLEWPTRRFGFGLHDLSTIFLLWLALPFIYSLLIEGAVYLTDWFRHRDGKKRESEVPVMP